MSTLQRYAFLAGVITVVLWSTACGGGGTAPTAVTSPPTALAALRIGPATLPAATRGFPYNFASFTVQSGSPPYSFTATGNLPPGLTFTSLVNPNTGVIQGTPTTAGTFDFTVTATDTANRTGSHNYSLIVDTQFRITTIALPTAKFDVPYSQPILSTNGIAPITWTTTGAGNHLSGFGLSLDPSTGHISGSPTVVGFMSVEVEGTDSSSPPRTARQFVQLQIVPRLSFSGPPTLVFFRGVITTGTSVSLQGGVTPITLELIGGTVPPGLRFNGTGFLGTPTQLGIYTVTLRASDSYIDGPEVITGDVTLEVREKPPTIVTSEMTKAIVGRPYNFTLSVDGGTRPFTWAPQPGVPGLSFDTTQGSFSGIPTAAGNFQLFFNVQDSSSPLAFASRSLNLQVDAAPRGRNDSIPTATPIHDGVFPASISPFVNGTGVEAPDTDYYVATANGGATVSIRVMHDTSRSPASPMDPVLEIVNASGQRLTTCRNQGTDDGVTGAPDTTPNTFNDVCLVDDNILGFDLDSSLELQIPAGAAQTFYIHVLDFSGDARPDLKYQLLVSGVN